MTRRIVTTLVFLFLCSAVGFSATVVHAAAAACPDLVCDDGQFCNGVETCTGTECSPGLDPCPGRACDEGLDLCLPGQAPQLEAGWVSVGGKPEVVLLANSYRRPVVVAGVHYSRNDPPLVVRVRQLTSETLELYLQNPSGAAEPQRRVSYLVVEEGAWEVGGQRFEAQRLPSTITDQEGQMVGETATYLQSYQQPVVVGQVMSARDPAWSVFWAGEETGNLAPAWDALRAGKSVGADPQNARVEEVLGFVVFEAGHGQLGGVELEAGVTGLSVVGMENDPQPYEHPYLQGFQETPEIALTSVAGLIRADAGWSVVPTGSGLGSQSLLSKTSLPLAIDEDQLGDAERRHATERVAYLVFDRPFSYQHSPMPPQGFTYPGGSEYYSCQLDQSVLDASCPNAEPAIQQRISECEQRVDACETLVDVIGECASCLSPFPSWKKLPVLAFIACAPQCGPALYDFITCGVEANSILRHEVELDICTFCGGTTCGNRFGIEVNVSGLQCNEAVATFVQCSSEDNFTILSANYLDPTVSLPSWCRYPDDWEVSVSEVIDLANGGLKRSCTPAQRSGPAHPTNDVQANFDCSCSGADCGDTGSFPLVADVACMPVNSWFKLRTTVTDACGGTPQERDVRVDYANPQVTRFPISLQAQPGDRITSLVIEDSSGATCTNVADVDSTVPSDPPGGEHRVAVVDCQDDVGAGGCGGDLPLTGRVTGDGLPARPSGVTLRITVGGMTETKAVTTSSTTFQTRGQPGQSFTASVQDRTYTYGPGGFLKSVCLLQSPSAGTIPAGQTFEIARVDCNIETVTEPPQPPILPPLDPFVWDWDPGFDCLFMCDPNPPGSSGEMVPCDPCTFCRDSDTGICSEPCLCERVDVPGGECGTDCDSFFNLSPGLSVTAGAAPSTSGQLKADDVLTVSASASDGDGLQGFVVSVDGEFQDLVEVNGTSGSFSELAVDTSALPEGEHVLQVIALDDHGIAPTPGFLDLPFEVDHTVDPCAGDTAPPALTITEPLDGALLSPGTVGIRATASDPGSGVKHLKFWVGSHYLGIDTGAPYGRWWNATPGNYVLKVRAEDHCGQVQQESVVVTVIDPCESTPGPMVEISNYEDDQWVEPGLFYFEADASAAGSGIDRVEFEVESFTNVSVDEAAPFVSTGWYLLSERDEVITARVYDGCGRMATDTITLHVNEDTSVCEVDHSHPWAGIPEPEEGSIHDAGPVTVRANAADDGVLLAAVLEVDGSLVPDSTILSSNPANYVWTWEATPGPHVIRVKVVDVCWKIGWSLPRTVTVQ